MYMVWTRGDLKQADIEFFKRAEVSTEDGVVFAPFRPMSDRQCCNWNRVTGTKQSWKSAKPFSACSPKGTVSNSR